MFDKEPINNVKWIPAQDIKGNDYNPNHVMKPEMKLLEHSILTNGWIQPIIINPDGIIIDGFHRHYLSMVSPAIRSKYQGKVPVVEMAISEAEAMMLTIRINRAKGTHAAIKMSDIVRKLIDDHQLSFAKVADGIGASMAEIELLYKGDVFKVKNIAEWSYSKSWIPKETNHEN